MLESNFKLYVDLNHYGIKGLFTSENIPANCLIFKFKGELLSKPNKYSLQIDEKKHLDSSRDIDDNLNHSCEPNSYIDFTNLSLISKRVIKRNEEITFNYCTTEEKLSKPFECYCGSINCYKIIKGFEYLDKLQKEKLFKYLSPYLKKKYF